ncbi:MAG: hypothetical protein HWE27_18045 [Gammaproteobacteria bacterium]|nr:hypothetical protein [Gammaproteobacteria bacterium]
MCTLFLFCSVANAKNYYRYKNSKGQFELVEQLSPEAIAAGYDVINDKGQLIERVAPGKTLGEIEDEKEEIKEAKRKEFARQQQLRRDAELLKLFRSEIEILRARDTAVSGIDQRIELSKNQRSLLKSSIEDLQKRAADFERSGKPVPQYLKDNISETQKQIADRERREKVTATERAKVVADYDRDLIRFKELQTRRMVMQHQDDKTDNAELNQNRIFLTCFDESRCNDIWQKAQEFAKNKASGTLEIISESVLLTSAPKNDSELSISFARLPSNKKTYIVLEVICNDTEAGAELCKQGEANRLLTEFQGLITPKSNEQTESTPES